MCVYLPRWPLQNLRHSRPALRDKPVVIIRRSANGARVILCCARAAQAGIRSGMPLAEAQAIHPQLFLQDEDPARDRLALERLAEGAQRYSPIVGLDEDSLLLDISGCAACFHGEDRLAQLAVRELRSKGWNVRVAVADTLGAAWAVAHTMAANNGRFCIVSSEKTEETLGPLPVWALRVPAEAVEGLAALGIERIEQLASLPRSSVPGRFGAGVLERLDQALGRLPEPIVPHRSPPEIQAGCSFEYPTDRRALLDHALEKLLERIEATLKARNRGARNLECWFHYEAAAPLCTRVELFRPSRSGRHLGKLLRTRLEQVQIAEPVCRVRLRVPDVELMAEHQFELFDSGSSRLEEVSDLIDRLAGQFGREAVTFPRLVDDCQPEYACRFEPAISGSPGRQKQQAADAAPVGAALAGHRPLQVWPAPLPIQVLATFAAGVPLKFLWNGKEYTVNQAWGPERIETGWWRGCDVQRDYYTVETQLGTRLWLFRRQEDGRWFLHGCFD
jgi:protein ImuB